MRNVDTSPPIRRGRKDEAVNLAELHVEVWRATYGDLAPKRAVELLDQAKRLPYWTAAAAVTTPGRGVWVADDGVSILGVVSVGSSDISIYQGRAELKHLYVVNGAQGQGLGEKLLKAAILTVKPLEIPVWGLLWCKRTSARAASIRKWAVSKSATSLIPDRFGAQRIF